MPNRILRDGILQSERVDRLSQGAELFFRRLMSVADDYGRFHAHPSLLRSSLYPLRIDQVTNEDILNWLGECETAGVLTTYEVDAKKYLALENWRQFIRKKTESKFPDKPGRCNADATHMQCRCVPSNECECEGECVCECECECECGRTRSR